MKIAYLSTFYPFRGGIAQFNASLYRELQSLGHDVDAYTFKTQYPNLLFPGETQFVKEDDIVDIIDSKRVLSTINPVSYYTAAKIIKAANPDLLIMKYWMSFFAPALGTVAKKMSAKTKVITILDNVIPHEKKFFDKPFTKYFLKQNHSFIAMSEKVKNDLLSFIPDANVKLMPHPLYNHFGEIVEKTSARDKLKIDDNKKTILFFGFIRDYKGLDMLINSFKYLDDSYQLVIAGEVYGSFEKYSKLIDANPNKHNIHRHIKYISDNEVPYYFSAADVCVLPYKSATQSGIAGISYHFDTPLIATDVGGLKEMINDKETGLIISKTSEKEIANKVQEFFELNKTQDFKENIAKIKNDLSWNKFAKEITKTK